ncbi:hypothetical protein [Schlesneria paludicola]|uniref:hypothetical protein n=1 Tax=Schlesneria paludicola TaxID=360056 RepID=UPI00029A2444|nr:hypothetical protein [Schlesneria paludicola]
MHRLTLVTFIGLLVISSVVPAAAQQRRRPVTFVFQQSLVAKTQWSPDASNPAATADGAERSATGTVPGVLPADGAHSDPTAAGSSLQTAGNQAVRPTLQQLQNPSGGYTMTHANYSQGQYTSPNNYNGSQFNTWNNLRQPPQNLDLFQSFNRTQPPTTWGGYMSPNTYIGPANNQWSNLSTGYITPNVVGGWTYQN